MGGDEREHDTVVRVPAPATAHDDGPDTVEFGTTTRRVVLRGVDPTPGRPPTGRRGPAPLRGPLNRIRLGGLEPLALDRPVLVGRAPRLPRIGGGEQHLLVRVDSPRREVSSTHLELRQVGSAVVATDLRTTNGSIITLPDGRRVRITQGETLVVAPGTVIDVGDGNLIQVLAPDEAAP